MNDTKLPDAKSLPHHSKDVHTCGSCRTQFDSLEEFIHHKLFAEGFRLFYCPSSKDPTVAVPHFLPSSRDGATNQRGLSNLLVAQENHVTNEDQIAVTENGAVRKLYPCQVCDQAYSKEVYAQRHFDLVHQKVVNSQGLFVCSKCGTSFKRSQTLRVHWLTHSQNRKFRCPYAACHFAFKMKGSLVRHIRRHTGEKPFTCHQCDRRFSESGALSRHLKSCLSCNQKSVAEFAPYSSIHLDCQQGRNTPIDILASTNHQSNKLEIEENAEINIIDVQGTIQRVVHPVINGEIVKNEVDEPPHCPICGKQFKLKDSMRKHLLDHSGERRYACSICNKTYKRSSHVKEHLRLHEEKGRQVCHICSQDFKTPRSLKAHLGTHTADLLFSCTDCGNRFRTKHNMLRHMATHNKAYENQSAAQ